MLTTVGKIIQGPGGNREKGTEDSQAALVVWALGSCPNLTAHREYLGPC